MFIPTFDNFLYALRNGLSNIIHFLTLYAERNMYSNDEAVYWNIKKTATVSAFFNLTPRFMVYYAEHISW